MLVDLRKADVPSALDADLCIAGAGAAGITIALQFIDTSQRVVLLEGGGEEFEEESQSIYEGPLLGRSYFSLDTSRLRFFGGSSNHWGGMCRRLDPLDFEPRPWVPYSGWPIKPEDLAPFEPAANEILRLVPPGYDPEALAPQEARLLELDPNRLVHRPFRLSRPQTVFGERYRRNLARAPNLKVFLHANVVDIKLADQLNRTLAFHVVAPEGRRIEVRARQFVLALGGIETPRLLLNANRQTAAGVGNQHDLVGRFFCEHPNKYGATLTTTQGDAILAAYRPVRIGNAHVWHSVALAPEVQEREKTLNLAMTIHRPKSPIVSPGYLALQDALEKLGEAELSGLGESMLEVVRDLDGAATDAYRWLSGTLETQVRALLRSEQAPNPESRVKLVDETDRLGLRRAGLDWRLGELEKHTMKVAVRLLGEEIGRLGAGRLHVHDWLRDQSPTIDEEITGGAHHMGTTRMADEPKQGVVDSDCRIHGIDNAYVAGSSVFPSVGFANPTLTIVMLALRLAEHLKRRLNAT